MLSSQYLEACFDKWRGVFFQGWNITLFLFLPAKSLSQIAPEKRESIVHVDDNTYASRDKQVENVSGVIHLLFRVMAISDCVYSKNEVKRIPETWPLYSSRRRNIGN